MGHGSDLPVPKPPEVFDDVILDISSDTHSDAHEHAQDEFQHTLDNLEPKLFTQTELNDLVKDLGLTKEKAELLGPTLKEKNFSAAGTNTHVYRRREQTFSQFFKQEGDLVYCSDITDLMNESGIEYKKEEWRLFIDSFKTSLKSVLLHSGNTYALLPVAHFVHMKESY